MSVESVSARFTKAGLPRSRRSIQRNCQRDHLICTTVDSEISEMYLIADHGYDHDGFRAALTDAALSGCSAGSRTGVASPCDTTGAPIPLWAFCIAETVIFWLWVLGLKTATSSRSGGHSRPIAVRHPTRTTVRSARQARSAPR